MASAPTDSVLSRDSTDMMSVSPAGPTPGRTPNGTLPPLRRRRQVADPLVRPKDRNKRPPAAPRQQQSGNTKTINGLAPGRTQVMPQHGGRPPAATLRRSTPDLNAVAEPTSGFSCGLINGFQDFPLVTTKKALMEGLRHHVARFASKKFVDPRNDQEFTRPVRLHRRDPRIPLPGRENLAEGEVPPADEADKALQAAQKEERKKQREYEQSQIAPSVNAGGQRKNIFGKKTQQIYRNDQTDEQKAASRLRYEEAMPWHLEDFDNKSTWVGTYEAALSDTHVIFILGQDGKFRMIPVEKWYKFTSKQQFKILTTEEAEKAMDKKVTQPRWFMETQKANQQAEEERANRAPKKLFTVKGERKRNNMLGATGRRGVDPDADDLDFEEDRFADDEENPYLEIPEEDAKQIEEKVKRDQLQANFFDNKDEKEADEEEEAQKKARELEKTFGKSYKKSLMRQEKNYIYDSDSDNPYGEESDSENSEIERRKEEERKKAEEAKNEASDHSKSKGTKTSKTSSGANTPSGRSSKQPNAIKKSISSTTLKRPGSPSISEVSGNESSRKKRKQLHKNSKVGTASQPSLKPPSRPMSPDYAPPSSSAPARPSQVPASGNEAKSHKRNRADAASGSDASGGEMSDGTRKKQKLKLRMSPSPTQSPPNSRAVSPEVKTEGTSRAANGAKPGSPPNDPPAPLAISPEEIRSKIPPEGITIAQLVKHFRGRIGKDQMSAFKRLMVEVSEFNHVTKIFKPKKPRGEA